MNEATIPVLFGVLAALAGQEDLDQTFGFMNNLSIIPLVPELHLAPT